jgi:hypothetical protein
VETWTEVDRSADHHVEVKGLSSAMRHLMPVVPDPVHDAIIAVQVAWNRLPRVRVQRGERCLKRLPLRKILADTASGRILNLNARLRASFTSWASSSIAPTRWKKNS